MGLRFLAFFNISFFLWGKCFGVSVGGSWLGWVGPKRGHLRPPPPPRNVLERLTTIGGAPPPPPPPLPMFEADSQTFCFGAKRI